jgi:transcription elongation factor GreA
MSAAADQLRSITREGHERVRAQLAELVSVRRPEVARRLRDARDAGGGPDDNPDHSEALEEHALLERRIAALRHTLALAEIIDYAADGTASIGAHVRLRMPSGQTMRYQLVGVAEADPRQRRISIDSPVGRAILGRCHGDIVDVHAPSGRHRIEILDIQSPATARAA